MMTKDCVKVQKPALRVPPEKWPNMMLTDITGFSLRYLLPRRWWPQGPKNV